jgi:hypothetical protein
MLLKCQSIAKAPIETPGALQLSFVRLGVMIAFHIVVVFCTLFFGAKTTTSTTTKTNNQEQQPQQQQQQQHQHLKVTIEEELEAPPVEEAQAPPAQAQAVVAGVLVVQTGPLPPPTQRVHVAVVVFLYNWYVMYCIVF